MLNEKQISQEDQKLINESAARLLNEFMNEFGDKFMKIQLDMLTDAVLFNDDAPFSVQEFTYFSKSLIFMLDDYKKCRDSILLKKPDIEVQGEA